MGGTYTADPSRPQAGALDPFRDIRPGTASCGNLPLLIYDGAQENQKRTRRPVGNPQPSQSPAAISGDSQSRPWRAWLERLGGGPGGPQLRAERRGADDRRTHSLKSFTYGSFRPRRRHGRRDGDHDRIFLDWHEPRVLYLVLAIVLMCAADALFTLNLLAVGAEELNVLMRALLIRDVEAFLAIKIGVTSASVVLLAIAARRRFMGLISVFRVLQVFCVAYAILIVYELWLFGNHLASLSLSWRSWFDLMGF